MQIAKSLGAEVTGVCSTRNAGLVATIGADQVIDYTQDDFTRGAQRYDILLDTVVNRSLPELRRLLTAKGTFVFIGGVAQRGRWLGPAAQLLNSILLAPFVSQRIAAVTGKANKDDLQALRELIEAGQVTPVIDWTYTLDHASEAIRYLQQGHARGKVVITVGDTRAPHNPAQGTARSSPPAEPSAASARRTGARRSPIRARH